MPSRAAPSRRTFARLAGVAAWWRRWRCIASLLREQIVWWRHVAGSSRAGRFQPSLRVIDTLAAVLQRDRDWHLLDAAQGVQPHCCRSRPSTAAAQRSAVLVRGGRNRETMPRATVSEMLRQKYRAAHSTEEGFTTALQALAVPACVHWNMSLATRRRWSSTPVDEATGFVDERYRLRRRNGIAGLRLMNCLTRRRSQVPPTSIALRGPTRSERSRCRGDDTSGHSAL
jgi:hypothetical protein